MSFPVIAVGNLRVGGTGKSPMTAYLIAMLQNDFQVNVVSRGYGRKTQDYIAVQENSAAEKTGDEPLMLKRKFPKVNVSVDANRIRGIERLTAKKTEKTVVILDDAFQHRAVQAGLTILLTAYDDLFTDDFVLPAGRLRERRKNYKRAEIIVITKCPGDISAGEKRAIIEKIQPQAYQSVYFSSVKYADLMPFSGDSPFEYKEIRTAKYDNQKNCLLVTGIANGRHLEAFLQTKFANVFSLHFSDHHPFSLADLEKIRAKFGETGTQKNIIITTEKDAVRLLPFQDWLAQNAMPLYVQPISVTFEAEDEQNFRMRILNFLNSFAPENLELK